MLWLLLRYSVNGNRHDVKKMNGGNTALFRRRHFVLICLVVKGILTLDPPRVPRSQTVCHKDGVGTVDCKASGQ
jgi:hypothetical protein